MKKMTLTLFARTPVHVGAGNSVGAVDSPVQRERHTKIPIIPGSSLKGVLSDLWNERGEDGKLRRTAKGKELFGEDDQNSDATKAGTLLIGEARVLAFPVRSARGMFAWITCPLALRRFARETGVTFKNPSIKDDDAAQAFESVKLSGKVILEEYVFTVQEEPDSAIVQALENLVENDPVWSGIKEQLVIVSDEIFQHFCEHACEVVTRIKVDDETGVVVGGALFNLEQVPSETLFYTTVMAGGKGDAQVAPLEQLKKKLEEEKIIQVGGDATTGLGFCTVTCKEVS